MSVVIPSDFFRFRSFPSTSVSCCRHHWCFCCFGPPYPAGRMTHPLRRSACLADRTFAVQVFRPVRLADPSSHWLPARHTIRLSAQSGCLYHRSVLAGRHPGGSVRLCTAPMRLWAAPGALVPDAALRMSAMHLPDMFRLRFLDPLRLRFSRSASVLRLYGMTGGVENRVLWPSISPKRWSNHSERAQSIFSGIVIVVWKRGFPISVCDARMNSHIRATMSG